MNKIVFADNKSHTLTLRTAFTCLFYCCLQITRHNTLDKIKYQVYLNIFHSERKYLGASKIANKLQRLFFEIHPVEFQ